MGRGQTLFLQQREKWAHHGGWIPFNHQLLIVPAPGFTLLLQCQPAPHCHFALKGAGASNEIFGKDSGSR